jgi:hypothetical protein
MDRFGTVPSIFVIFAVIRQDIPALYEKKRFERILIRIISL